MNRSACLQVNQGWTTWRCLVWISTSGLNFHVLVNPISDAVLFHTPVSQEEALYTICSPLGMQPCRKVKQHGSQPPSSAFLIALNVKSTFQVNWQLPQQLPSSKRQSTFQLFCNLEAFFQPNNSSPAPKSFLCLTFTSLIFWLELCHHGYYSYKKTMLLQLNQAISNSTTEMWGPPCLSVSKTGNWFRSRENRVNL